MKSTYQKHFCKISKETKPGLKIKKHHIYSALSISWPTINDLLAKKTPSLILFCKIINIFGWFYNDKVCFELLQENGFRYDN